MKRVEKIDEFIDESAEGNLVWEPDHAVAGLVFYPGGKVEHKAYIPLTDNDISSFANTIINDIDNTYFKFTKNPPTPSIKVTPDIEQPYPVEGVTYEWKQKPINISLRVSANCTIDGLIFSYKPRYRVTWK